MSEPRPRAAIWNRFQQLPASTLLAVSGVVLFVAMLGVSAALAPSIGSTPSEGYQERTLVGSQGGGPGWHQYGSVYLLNGSSVVWREDAAESYFDVTRTENGTVLAGFMDGGYEACGPYESPCVRTGFQVIDSDSGEVRPGYSFPVRTRTNSEVHDVEQLQSGEYLLTDMEYERIFTVKDGEVTWQWNASSFYDAPADPTRTDWLHINDVDVIDNGRYLVSVRNANQLLIVERGDGVVEVINEDRSNRNDDNCRQSGQLRDTDSDGDIRCGDPAVLNHQHNPQWLGEEAVLVADSDNDRVVELHKQDGEWQPSWTLTRTGGIALDWPRDADRLPNGNTLITDTLNRRIVEVNENGTVVWSYQTKRIPYEADRLPVGETVGGPQSDTSSVDDPGSEGSIPGLSILLVGLRALYPGLPFWFGEIQLLGTFISIGLTLSGGALHVRQRR